jgi:hypothetical protein
MRPRVECRPLTVTLGTATLDTKHVTAAHRGGGLAQAPIDAAEGYACTVRR